jgi:hypothetical protein
MKLGCKITTVNTEFDWELEYSLSESRVCMKLRERGLAYAEKTY